MKENREPLQVETPQHKKEVNHDYRVAFFYISIYIILNLAFNISSKFLYKNPQPEKFSTLDICLARGTTGIIIMLIITKHNKLELYKKGDPVNRFLLLRGIAGIFYFASMTYCVGHGAISTVFLSQNLSPMISSVAAYYIFNEKLNRIDILSLVIGFGGVLLILLPKTDNDGNILHMQLLHKVLIVMLPFMMSALQLLIKKLKTVDNYVINFHYALVSTIGYIVWSFYELAMGEDQSEFMPKYFSLRNFSLLLTCSISHVFALVYWTKAFQKGETGKVGIMTYQQIVYSMLVDIFVFQLDFSLLQVVGMLIVFISSLSVAIMKF